MGSSRKIKWCCHDASTRITHGEKGIGLHCFRCGETDWEAHGTRSIAEIMAARAAIRELSETRIIPERAVTLDQAPNAAIVWLLKGGVTPEQAEKLGFKYDPLTRRVLMPVEGGFLGRSVFNERPKYLMAGPAGVLYWAQTAGSRVAVAVEDILSALAVQRVGYTGCGILGTSLTGDDAARLAGFPHVIGWFDGDTAGDKAWVTLRKRMRLHPTTLTRIRTDKDPKALPRAEVKRLIQEQL